MDPKPNPILNLIILQQFMKQKEYEAKFNVDLVQDPQSGKTKFIEREKDEVCTYVQKQFSYLI